MDPLDINNTKTQHNNVKTNDYNLYFLVLTVNGSITIYQTSAGNGGRFLFPPTNTELVSKH